jgi:hypothetical protein
MLNTKIHKQIHVACMAHITMIEKIVNHHRWIIMIIQYRFFPYVEVAVFEQRILILHL